MDCGSLQKSRTGELLSPDIPEEPDHRMRHIFVADQSMPTYSPQQSDVSLANNAHLAHGSRH